MFESFPDTPVTGSQLPLSVMLFHAAMQHELALSKYAHQLDISPLSLRQFITGQTQRPRGKTLEILANALELAPDEVRYRNTLLPYAAPVFAGWLEQRMREHVFSRARLSRETGISDGALRNYLDGKTLPDTDQAQRLAFVLHIDSLDMAHILVANHMQRQGDVVLPEPPHAPINGQPTIAAPPTEPIVTPDPLNGTSPPDQLDLTPDDMHEERRLLTLWRKLHPQGRRATLTYIAGLLAEY